jgi:large subunit ribosomal protein L19
VSVIDQLKLIEKAFMRTDLPQIEVGDVLRMRLKVAEADKIRIHPFEGTVIRKRGSGVHSTFTVRKVSFGEGVERTFPLHSPVIDSMEVVSKGQVRHARLYYLRDRVGKKARVQKQVTEETPA